MNTPVLTKKQQKQSLSAKKGPAKGLRNVLAQPHDTYWPVVGSPHVEKLNSVLQKMLPALKRPSLIKKKKKKKKKRNTECTELKEESIQIEEPLLNKDILNSVVLGINSVTRFLEQNNVCCVLLDANVEPPLLVKHIIMMAQNKKKPVLLLPSLKTLTSENIGFPCSALALKNKVLSLDHHFYTLYENIACISKNYPSRQTLKLFTSDEVFDCAISKDSDVDDNTLNVNKEFISLTNIYKVRSSCKERIFIPPNTAESLDNVEKETDFIPLNNDFIPFDNDMDVSGMEDEQHTRKTRYFKPCLIKNNTKSPNLLNKQSNSANNNSTSSGTSGKLRMENRKKKNSTRNDVNYLPLKIKRLKGNSNRVKATKVSKKKRKNQRK